MGVVLSPSHVMVLSPSHVMVLSPSHVMVLSPSHVMVLSPSHVVVLSPSHTISIPCHGTISIPCCGTISRVRTRFGIYEKVFKMTVPISRHGKGLEMRQRFEKSMTLAYKLCTSCDIKIYCDHDCFCETL